MDFEELDEKQRAAFIDDAVDKFRHGERFDNALEQLAYYETNNPDIEQRRKVYASEENGQAVAKENRFASNEKVASSFFRDITDSKVQYLAGEGADINALQEEGAPVVDQLTQTLGEQMKRQGQAVLTDALIYHCGYSYLQVIDGQLKLQYVPYMEVVPFYDRYGKLTNVLRYYTCKGKKYAEYHTPAMVYCFEYYAEGKSKKAKGEWKQTGQHWQITTATVYGDGSTELSGGKGWAVLPWFEMRHNNDNSSSLTNAAKSMIRCYDVTVSDFANNLIDVQDVFITQKDGYGSGMEYGEAVELLRTFKYSEGDTQVTTTDIPYQARQVFLDMMKADIYAALRGVDVGRISGGNLTNTAIRALYSDIDLWADQAEWHVKDWVLEICNAVAGYMGITLPPVTVTLTRRAIFDEVAQMDAIARQKGIISDKTLYENHPLIKDAQAELERVEAQELEMAYSEGMPE